MYPWPARVKLSDVLGTVPATLTVWDHPHVPDQPTGPTAVIAVTRVLPADVACPYARTEADVWVFTGLTDGPDAYDALDQLLAAVLATFDTSGIRWTEANPGVWNTTHPAYRITTEVYA